MDYIEYTEEQREDIKGRGTEFLEAYKELRDKYQMDFYSIPVMVPSEHGAFVVAIKTDVADLKYLPLKSEFMK